MLDSPSRELYAHVPNTAAAAAPLYSLPYSGPVLPSRTPNNALNNIFVYIRRTSQQCTVHSLHEVKWRTDRCTRGTFLFSKRTSLWRFTCDTKQALQMLQQEEVCYPSTRGYIPSFTRSYMFIRAHSIKASRAACKNMIFDDFFDVFHSS